MTLNSANVDSAATFTGLATYTYNIPNAGNYVVSVVSTIPLSSSLQIEIAKNGTNVNTVGGSASNPAPTQQQISNSQIIACVLGDVITVITSSSAAADQLANAVKTTVQIYFYNA